jgi:quinoprotein glucose dehydrogenase
MTQFTEIADTSSTPGNRQTSGIWIRAVGAIIVVYNLVILALGIKLALLGGSMQYAVLGGIGTVAGGLLVRRKSSGAWLVFLGLLLTAIWSVAEAGSAFWLLLPRLALPAVLASLLLLPVSRRQLGMRVDRGSNALAMFVVVVAALILSAGVASMQREPALVTAAGPFATGQQATDWRAYGNDIGGSRYAPLSQINVDNVAELQPAWIYRTGVMLDPAIHTFETTPLKVGDTLYLCTPKSIVIAVDAQTGKERWRFDPENRKDSHFHKICRGVSYHEQPGNNGLCGRRILAPTMDARLVAIDAERGVLCPDFGDHGAVSLSEGVGKIFAGEIYNSSPPVVIKDKVVIGGFIQDGSSTKAPGGVIRAYDAASGALIWAWDLGSDRLPTEPLPAGASYTRGIPNAWTPLSADPELNLIFVPLGNPAPDFFKANFPDYNEKYGSALVALDADTGKPRWHFQTVHHDLWDLDLPAQPIAGNIQRPEGVVPAVIQPTKSGPLFVLDRRSGVPIIPVHEQAAPQDGAAPEENLSPTQPISDVGITPPVLQEADMWGVTPIDQLLCRIEFRKLRYDGPYTPLGITKSLGYPLSVGFFSWGSASYDPQHNLVVAGITHMPFVAQLFRKSSDDENSTEAVGEWARHALQYYPMEGTPYQVAVTPFLSPLGIPCNQPPWGELVAFDLGKSRIAWRRPLGTARDNGPFGIPSMLPITIGVHNAGGAITTAGDLTFIAATTDNYLRAFQTSSGRELWRARLPAGGQATPMTYISEKDGRQYVVIAAGGHPGLGTTKGDYVIAYALPPAVSGIY